MQQYLKKKNGRPIRLFQTLYETKNVQKLEETKVIKTEGSISSCNSLRTFLPILLVSEICKSTTWIKRKKQ